MESVVEVKSIPEDLELTWSSYKVVSGKTEEGKVVHENNLQCEIKNTGSRTFDFIDCSLVYLDGKGKKIGFDSDGTFELLPPGGTVLISIPSLPPEKTVSSHLEIQGQRKDRLISRYASYMFISVLFIMFLYSVFYK